MLFSPYYRLKILKAFYRKDLKSFEANLVKIEPKDPLFAQFCRLYARQQLKADVDPQEWKNWIESSHSSHRYLLGRAYMEWVGSYLRNGKGNEALQAFTQKCEKVGFAHSDIYATVGLFNHMIKAQELARAHEFRQFILNQIHGKSFEESIRLKLSEVFVRLDKPSGNHWKQAYAEFERTKLYRKHQAFFNSIRETFHKIEAKYPLLLNIRTSEEEKKKLFDLLIQKISAKEPFSLIRLGDGESYGLGPEPISSWVFKSDIKSREMKWWGQSLPVQLREKIVGQFQDALYGADVVGIPNIFRFFRDFFKQGILHRVGLSLLSQTTQRGLMIVMESLKKDLEVNKYKSSVWFVEHRCHQILMDVESVQQMAQYAQKVLFVTQYSSETLQAVFSGFSMDFVTVPGERKGAQSLPFQVDELVQQVRRKTQPGTLVLVASGFAGKYFLHAAKSAGGVALDAGAMSDYWIGKKTRSIFDLI